MELYKNMEVEDGMFHLEDYQQENPKGMKRLASVLVCFMALGFFLRLTFQFICSKLKLVHYQ